MLNEPFRGKAVHDLKWHCYPQKRKHKKINMSEKEARNAEWFMKDSVEELDALIVYK